jgi:hypothetical protein
MMRAVVLAILFSGGCGRPPEASPRQALSANAATEVSLTFDAYADAAASLFRVYIRPGADTATDWVTIAEVVVGGGAIDVANPKITLSSASTAALRSYLGQTACFKVTAVAETAESDASNEICAQL